MLLTPDAEVQGTQVSDAPYSSLSTRQHQMFPTLTRAELERVRRFGELRDWQAGEQVYKSGHPSPGMLVILSGRVRMTRRDRHGVEHTVTEHGPSQFSAEVGQLSGRPSLVDGTAVEPVSAVVIAPDRLRELIVAEAEIGERMMRALILRRVALIEQGAGPVLVGKSHDARLRSLQGFLTRNSHPHTVVDESDEEAFRLTEEFGAEADDLPLVICPDGKVLRRPTDPELASHLGLLPDLDEQCVYDVAIVGAGPAGLATAVYAASEGLSVVVLDSRAPGGQAGASSRIENYLGFPTGISGQALAGRAFAQAQKFGAHIAIPMTVKALHCDEHPHRLELTCKKGLRIGNIRAHSIVIASGAVYRGANLDGLDKLDGRGVYYWASPVEAKLCRHQEIVVVGGGNSAGQGIVYLASHCAHIHVLIRRGGFEATMSRYLIDRIRSLPNVTVHPHSEVGWLETDDTGLSCIGLKAPLPDGADRFDLRHLFLFTGAQPNTAWLRTCGVQLDSKGFVLTGSDSACDLETSVKGVYAIGDARAGSTKRVAAAVGEGAAVVAQIHQALAARSGEYQPC
ncbi:FAD-dependent oxidoreductase [Paraburkholderia sp. ZP32-5]|uniref:FAD-dependent oxidoreductase n=1 Tax=Paraburkholderia sp. ZP32-5 TaxID=2883245 RepID=UPI001F1E807C|nr:FAD-dependent oxidoreductase [Paraburkholderia sp. ZP32-5]